MLRKALALMSMLFFCTTTNALGAESILLPEDTIIFKADFGGPSAAGFTQQLMLHQGEVLNIYIDSPGGSVFHLNQMISAVEAIRPLKKKVVCFADFAASAAFMFFNSVCDERVVQPHSVLMSHQAAYGIRGEENRIESFQKLIRGMLARLDKIVADKLGMSVEKFKAKSADEWWINGNEAVGEKLADKVAYLRCSPEMTVKKYTEKIQVFIFSVDLTWSKCPLLPFPLEINGEPTFGKDVKIPATSFNAHDRFNMHRDFYLYEVNSMK